MNDSRKLRQSWRIFKFLDHSENSAAIFILPAAFLFVVIFVIPLCLVVYFSLFSPNFTLIHFRQLVERPLYARVMTTTLNISLTATFATFIIGYPVAYHLSRQIPKIRVLLLVLVLLPFWTSILVKSFAFTVILGQNGIINTMLTSLFGEGVRMNLVFNRLGVIIGMAHYLLPFMILAILSSLLSQNPDLHRAASIMGASRARIFFKITFPLSLPGVLAGSVICVILSLGMFITPALLGGRQDYMVSNLIQLNVSETLNWSLASALSLVLIMITAILVVILGRVRKGELLD